MLQSHPRALLGCSSIVKMGVVTATFGTALAHPGAAPALLAAVSLYALHHLLVKGALFLGVGEWERTGTSIWLVGGLGLLALALAGLPLTGGAAAKLELKAAAMDLAVPAGPLLFLSATVTTLLLARFFWLISRRSRARAHNRVRPASVAWLLLVPLAVWLPFSPLAAPPDLSGLLPVVAGLGFAVIVLSVQRNRPQPHRRLVVCKLIRTLGGRVWPQTRAPRAHALSTHWLPSGWRSVSARPGMLSLATGGLLWLAVFVLMLFLVVSG
jgi:formate hydrogenlyase subunit 3/multisubunit Na+/H+ antiporter MnhD subunit